MITKFTYYTCLVLTILIGSTSQAQTVNIPDSNFKNILLNDSSINTNFDSEIQLSEAQNYTDGITIYDNTITDLTGIEAFINMTSFFCYQTQINSIDLSSNTNLTEIYCYDNSQLVSLILGNNTVLTELYCYGNQLSSLDLSSNTALTEIYCYDNQITDLNLGNNAVLTQLYCYNNQLTNLDVSNNTALTDLYCYDNALTSLDVTYNLALTGLGCQNNQLVNLDVSLNTLLTDLACNDNLLTSLNVANGNNENMNQMLAHNNPNLTCIQHDMDFDPTTKPYDEVTQTGWHKDASANWSNDCSTLSTNDFSINQNQIILYPNPASNVVNIKWNREKSTQIEVFNLAGQKVLQKHVNGTTARLKTDQLRSGIYILKVENTSQKLIIK
jgi:hypothetical protein